jgi:hypothetical protein
MRDAWSYVTPACKIGAVQSRFAFALCIIGVACKSTPKSEPAPDIPFSFGSPEAKAAGDSIDAFAADLHGAVAGQEGNVFYSPAASRSRSR